MRALLPFVAAACAAGLPPAQERPPAAAVDRLLVANKAEGTLSIFDPAARTERLRLPTGDGPHEVAVAPDGRIAVVSDYGGQKPGSTLTVVDLAEEKVLRTIALTEPGGERLLLRPHGLAFVGPREVAFTSESARRLGFVDVVAGKVLRTVPTPQTTMHMVARGGDARLLAATSIREGSVALFDLHDAATGTPTIVATGDGAEGLAVHPTTGEVWVANRAANTVSVVDRAAAKVAGTLETGDFPFRVAFTPDGAFALVTCAEGGDVQMFDAAAKARVASIPIHGDASEQSALPMGLCVDPDGRRCYVACGRGEFVAVIDLAKREVVARLPAGRGCDGIAFARLR